MTDEQVIDLIHTHRARYAGMEIADVYKLLHQATFGPGHLIKGRKAALEWLEEEAVRREPNPQEPLVENIHPTGEIVRFHIRAYLMHRTDVNWLLDAFIRSAAQVEGDPETMALRWQVFVDLCQPGNRCADDMPLREVRLFGRARAAEHWPAVHHSPYFQRAYVPSYRVLTRHEAETLCQKLKVPFEVV
ncbi:MAG: hypothetical protein GYB65_04170 [Chloroflexi bacterium]|nr:hypothetical protein [Chloroflexota bacterium]